MHSSTYKERSIITVPEPLSAGLITMSERVLSFVRALRSSLERLPRIEVGLDVMISFSIALMKVSRAASLPVGGVQVPLHFYFTSSDGWVESVRLLCWKNSFSRRRLAKSFMSA